MKQANPVTLAVLMALVAGAMGAVSILKGGLYIGKHEGDALHMLQIVLRMVDGQTPHVDFMTPIGALAFAPVTFFVEQGHGIGMSVLWAQVLVAAVLFLPTLWIAWSRYGPGMAQLFGVIVMVLCLALVHGEADRNVSISMHYNRWAWAAAFLAISAALLPSLGTRRPVIDGVIIGLAVAAMALIKATYIAALLPGILLALVLRGHFREIVVALIAGLLLILAMSLWLGIGYWTAYAGDLITVLGSDVRAQPGEPFQAILGAPAYLAGTLAVIAGVIFLRQGKEPVGGLVLLVLLPGFAYVTYQNFGNDPQWLLLLGVMLVALRPGPEEKNAAGTNLRAATGITAAIALSLAAPSFFNLAYSPFRHMAVETSSYAPLLPEGGVHTDLQTAAPRMAAVLARVSLDRPGAGLEDWRELADLPEASVFQGEEIPFCTLQLGSAAWFETIVSDLEENGFAGGKRIFAADVFSSHWLFGDFEPLQGGAPWYYGGLPGWENADYLIVPFCPVMHDVQGAILSAIEDTGEVLTEVRRTPLYVLYARAEPG